MSHWALSIQPKIPDILVGTSNGTDHFGLVRPEYSGPALKVVHFDRSGHFGRSVGPKCPFPFDKIVVPSTALLYPAYKNNNQTRGGLGRVCATGMYRSIGHVEFPTFQMGLLLNGKHPIFRISRFGRYSDKPLRLTLITNINIYPQLLLSVLTPNHYA